MTHDPITHGAVSRGAATDLFLLGHGSRDSAASQEFADLLALVAGRTAPTRARGGFLELAEPHVDAAIDAMVAEGSTDVVAVPYVLFGAGHLKDDGPAVLDRARRRHPGVRFRLARDLGVHPAVLETAEDRARTTLAMLAPSPGPSPDGTDGGTDETDDTTVVLVGRGSTDPDGCAEFVKFARLLGDGRGLGPVEPAFIAMTTPTVTHALERCRRLGARRIAVVPLFLFAGRLVTRIAEQVAAWSAEHPEVDVVLGAHLGVDGRLADVVVERHREPDAGDVRMNCDLCAYRVRLPGYEEKVGTPLSLAPPERKPRGWRARRAANQAAEDAATIRERPRRGLGRRSGIPAPPDRDGPAVAVTGLAHRFPDGTDALAGVDLTVATGERVAVLGPNGSGKTTLALHLVGALERATGTVEVAGLAVAGATLATVRRRVGFVFQDPDDQLLLPTVAADVAFAPANQGLSADEQAARVTAALDVVGLTDAAERAPQNLSLGERRRVALAGVLAAHPEVIVLDEPTANLDPAARRDLAEVIRGLELTTLVITHDLPLAAELCPRSVVLAHGRVAADGPTDALLANPALLAAHRLELPYRMAPVVAASPSPSR
jgi:cobalt/nickel transport system ATP-binding protein